MTAFRETPSSNNTMYKYTFKYTGEKLNSDDLAETMCLVTDFIEQYAEKYNIDVEYNNCYQIIFDSANYLADTFNFDISKVLNPDPTGLKPFVCDTRYAEEYYEFVGAVLVLIGQSVPVNFGSEINWTPGLKLVNRYFLDSNIYDDMQKPDLYQRILEEREKRVESIWTDECSSE